MDSLRLLSMATIAPGSALFSHSISRGAAAERSASRTRRITPEAGRAIEMLGHAIEYLADEFALECRSRDFMPAGKHARVAAIELLMARNREVYFSCPTVPTLGERLRSLLRLQSA